jgi:hypothetical protein
MKKKPSNHKLHYAVWIDQREAIIACQQEDGQITTSNLRSDVDSHVRFPGEKPEKSRLNSIAFNHQNHLEHRKQNQLKNFLKSVASQLGDMGYLLIMGPAETKFELQKELGRLKPMAHAQMEVRTADRMKLHEIKSALQQFGHA